MKEKIINLLENDYCKLSKQLATENNKEKKDLIIGAMGYIVNLQKEISKISENNGNNGLFNNIKLGQLSSITLCNNCGFSMFIYANQEKAICEHCGAIIKLKLKL